MFLIVNSFGADWGAGWIDLSRRACERMRTHTVITVLNTRPVSAVKCLGGGERLQGTVGVQVVGHGFVPGALRNVSPRHGGGNARTHDAVPLCR